MLSATPKLLKLDCPEVRMSEKSRESPLLPLLFSNWIYIFRPLRLLLHFSSFWVHRQFILPTENGLEKLEFGVTFGSQFPEILAKNPRNSLSDFEFKKLTNSAAISWLSIGAGSFIASSYLRSLRVFQVNVDGNFAVSTICEISQNALLSIIKFMHEQLFLTVPIYYYAQPYLKIKSNKL